MNLGLYILFNPGSWTGLIIPAGPSHYTGHLVQPKSRDQIIFMQIYPKSFLGNLV
jgi:hypothetical protein